MNKTIQDLKLKIETIKKPQRYTTLEIENLWKRPGVIDTHYEQNTRDRRENLRCRRFHREHWHNNQRKCKMRKAPNPKHPRKPEHNEKTKPTDNKSRWEWRFSTQRASKYLQQNYRRKLPKPKERDAHEHTRSLQNSK